MKNKNGEYVFMGRKKKQKTKKRISVNLKWILLRCDPQKCLMFDL